MRKYPVNTGMSFKCLIALAVLLTSVPGAAELILHREKSLYRNIVVQQKAGRRCLVFTVKREERSQTCMNIEYPREIVFSYVRMSLAGLLANPNPRQALMIGMGGGTISNVLTEVYPALTMDLVEIDEAVVRVAKEYFSFEESPRTTVHIMDGRVFVRRALLQDRQYDLIILDAFTGDYIPEHLMTREFLVDVRSLLTPGGVVVANTFTGSRLYDHESQTYRVVFGDFLNFKLRGSGNRVIVASNSPLPDNEQLLAQAGNLQQALAPYAVDPMEFVPHLNRKPDWDTSERVLTDQYAPVNLLRGRK